MSHFARILTGVVFMLSAIAKLSTLESFELYIFSFGLAGFDVCSLAARVIIVFEFLIGAGLASRILYRFSWISGAVSLIGFTFFLLWRALSGDTGSCHCMGELIDMNPLQSIVKNLVLGVLMACAWNCSDRRFRFDRLLTSILIISVFILVFAIKPPDSFYRKGRVSNDLVDKDFTPVADSLGLSEGKRIICLYSATCEHCRHCASKMASIISRHDIPKDSVSVIFMQTHENQDSVSLSFFKEYGEEMVLENSYLHPLKFIPMTNGSMPLIVLTDNGRLVKEYDYISLDEKEIAGFLQGSNRD